MEKCLSDESWMFLGREAYAVNSQFRGCCRGCLSSFYKEKNRMVVVEVGLGINSYLSSCTDLSPSKQREKMSDQLTEIT